MKKFFKIVLWIAAASVALGAVLTVVGCAASGLDIGVLSNAVSVEKRYEESVENPISALKIEYKNAKLEVVFDQTAQVVTVSYPQLQNKNGKDLSTVTVTDTAGVLTITERIKTGLSLFGWNFTTPKVLVTLPADGQYALDFSTDNGNISLTGNVASLTGLVLETANGNVTLGEGNIVCTGSAVLQTDNGNIGVGNLSADSLIAETDNGNVVAGTVQIAGKAQLETNNGEIELRGKFTAESLVVETDNGEITAAAGIEANRIELTTDVGEIEAVIVGKKADYSIVVEVDIGNSNLSSNRDSSKQKTLSVTTDIGDITVRFTE